MYGSWYEQGDEPNGSKAVSLLLRLSTLSLALASAVTMATAGECTVDSATYSYRDRGAFVYQVGSSIAAAVLEAAAIYLQLSGGGEDDDGSKLPGVVLVVVDVLAQALLYSSTGAAYAGYGATAGCVPFCEQVGRSKLMSLGASVSVGLAAVVKDVPLPFSVWPTSSVDSSSRC